ncbi:hypothetical protein [Nocardioides panacisoli]|uniref:Uncharacterized protein n=1 Tax=Nocardioides panacisoli TaxID=627624 RepID=A0ABP7IUP0_9ACTN
MSSPKLTDEAVSRLPIQEGRADLLEEIMAIPTETPVTTDDLAERRESRRRRWLPALGAAAAVAAIAAAVAVPRLLDGGTTAAHLPVAAPGGGEIAVLQAPGWQLVNADSVDEGGGEISYQSGDETLDIDWRPADQYDSYLTDRQDIGKAEKVTVLGKPSLLWAYSAEDHTVIRPVVGDFMLEFRGSGMDEAAYRSLLGHLLAIDPADLDSYLPDSFVTDDERPDVIAQMLAPIPVPDGFDKDIQSDEIERYQLGAQVTGAVTCAWLDEYVAAKQDGDKAAMQQAVDAMATSRDWPILKEMRPEGGWSQVIWQFADELAAGTVPEDYAGQIGCGN